MIQYFFIFDQNANLIVFAKPKSNQKQFKGTLGLINQKTQLVKMKPLERQTLKHERFELVLQKMDPRYAFGCFVTDNIIEFARVYALFGRFYERMPDPKTLKKSKEYRRFVKQSIIAFNTSKPPPLERISTVAEVLENKLEREIDRSRSTVSDLVNISNQLIEADKHAKEAQTHSKVAVYQAKMLDFKMKLFLAGFLILIFIMAALFFLNQATRSLRYKINDFRMKISDNIETCNRICSFKFIIPNVLAIRGHLACRRAQQGFGVWGLGDRKSVV